MKPSDLVTLKIPRPLYQRLQKVIAGTGFRSVTEFSVYVLRDLASSHEMKVEPPPMPGSPATALTEREVEMIRKRLKSLGYIE